MTTKNASFFICLPLLTPLPANAGRDRQQQQAKRASMCVRVCVVLYVFCYSVRKIRSLLLILFSVTTSANEWRSRREIIRLAILAIA